MANHSSITTTGGIKVPACLMAPTSEPSPSSVFIAFSSLSDLIAEAAAAEERLGSPSAWDPALSSVVDEDAEAFNAAFVAAAAMVRMPWAVSTDRPLLVASQFLFQGLSMDTADARADFQLALRGVHPLDLTGRTRHLTLGAARMIDVALSRLWWLFKAIDADDHFEVDLPSDLDLDADQEVQAF